MKLQFDTTNKTIKVEESVNLKELTETLEKLLPNGEWKEFTLQTNTVIQNFSSPVIIRERNYPYWWTSPWYSPTVGGSTIRLNNTTEVNNQPTYSLSNKTPLNPGVYNVEA
jgi:hypothetical protein